QHKVFGQRVSSAYEHRCLNVLASPGFRSCQQAEHHCSADAQSRGGGRKAVVDRRIALPRLQDPSPTEGIRRRVKCGAMCLRTARAVGTRINIDKLLVDPPSSFIVETQLQRDAWAEIGEQDIR